MINSQEREIIANILEIAAARRTNEVWRPRLNQAAHIIRNTSWQGYKTLGNKLKEVKEERDILKKQLQKLVDHQNALSGTRAHRKGCGCGSTVIDGHDVYSCNSFEEEWQKARALVSEDDNKDQLEMVVDFLKNVWKNDPYYESDNKPVIGTTRWVTSSIVAYRKTPICEWCNYPWEDHKDLGGVIQKCPPHWEQYTVNGKWEPKKDE